MHVHDCVAKILKRKRHYMANGCITHCFVYVALNKAHKEKYLYFFQDGIVIVTQGPNGCLS